MKIPQKHTNIQSKSNKAKPSIVSKHTANKKPSLKNNKKPLSIIEDIFRAKKQEKQQEIIAKQQSKTEEEIKRQKKEKKIAKQLKIQMRMEQKLRKLHDGEIPSTKKTEGGLKIYTEQDLNIGNGGNTNLCPIDCKCCF